MSTEKEDMNKKDALLKLTLKAENGYKANASYVISANMWRDIILVCKGRLSSEVKGRKIIAIIKD